MNPPFEFFIKILSKVFRPVALASILSVCGNGIGITAPDGETNALAFYDFEKSDKTPNPLDGETSESGVKDWISKGMLVNKGNGEVDIRIKGGATLLHAKDFKGENSVVLELNGRGAHGYIRNADLSKIQDAITVSFFFQALENGVREGSVLFSDRFFPSLYLLGPGRVGLACHIGGRPIRFEVNRDLADGVWHHVAWVYDGASGVLTLYIDGVVVGTEEGLSGKIHMGQDELCIGARVSEEHGVRNAVAGRFDRIQIFDRALTTEEITSVSGK